MTATDKNEETIGGDKLEALKFQLERSRFRAEVAKWIIIAIGAAASFAIVDYGKLKIEEKRVAGDVQRQLLQAYLTATESPEPEVWKRKLQVLQYSSQDPAIVQWAKDELCRIDNYAARGALFGEAVRVASQLMERERLNDPERKLARVRFEQLYWADLPLADEGRTVEAAMIGFRNALLKAEASPDDEGPWETLHGSALRLAQSIGDEIETLKKASTCDSATSANSSGSAGN